MEAGGDQSAFWNQAARTRQFTHPLDHARFTRAVPLSAVLLFAVLTCVPSDEAQKNLLREFKRILRPGGLLLISDYPLQTDARNLERYGKFAHEPGGYGTFRLEGGAVVRHQRREWFTELLADFQVLQAVEPDVLTMNGNPARILQWWAIK